MILKCYFMLDVLQFSVTNKVIFFKFVITVLCCFFKMMCVRISDF